MEFQVSTDCYWGGYTSQWSATDLGGMTVVISGAPGLGKSTVGEGILPRPQQAVEQRLFISMSGSPTHSLARQLSVYYGNYARHIDILELTKADLAEAKTTIKPRRGSVHFFGFDTWPDLRDLELFLPAGKDTEQEGTERLVVLDSLTAGRSTESDFAWRKQLTDISKHLEEAGYVVVMILERDSSDSLGVEDYIADVLYRFISTHALERTLAIRNVLLRLSKADGSFAIEADTFLRSAVGVARWFVLQAPLI